MRRIVVTAAACCCCSSVFGQWTAIRLHAPSDYGSAIYAGAPGLFGGYRQTTINGPQVPGYWTGTSGTWTGLGTGSNLDIGQVNALWGDMQGGQLNDRAALWQGTPQSIRYLQSNGSSYFGTSVTGMAAGEQVGNGYFVSSNNHRALLWHGTEASMIDLTPAGANYAEVWATDGIHQVGGVAYPGQLGHSGFWTGTPGSFVPLDPPTGEGVGIRGMGGGQLVGTMDPIGSASMHAALWPSLTPNVIDMHPFPGFGSSILLATNGVAQVGGSNVPGYSLMHAGVWFGTSQSFMDLHAFLPPGYSSSGADSITESNGVFIIGGAAANAATGASEAFVWVGVPAPGSTLALALGWTMLRRRRSAW